MSITLPSQNLSFDGQLLRPRTSRDTLSRKVFLYCLLFIVSVSIYDTYLVTLYQDTILIDERNPICLLLIKQDTSQLKWFLLGKLVGNLFVVGTLLSLFVSGFRPALTIAKGVACFQFLLLIYLQFSDPLTGVLDFDGFVSSSPLEFREAVVSALAHAGVIVPTLLGSVLVKRKWEHLRAVTVG